ncbi:MULTISPECIES: hypothetical protein [unclassified Streptomyces]|uniref:hypothetical protein n=1 Tax=unclassified Streptomyces TaxID=2593676 RepID=UPI0022B70A9E|nr:MULTISPECIES: hypothetical protein [unclassified Streptomyces]MCZ7417709.1 hypothetical protein [Streptomyces sp. WMMC897]MCZ7432495.1 hypothetical protein [Streptomyces sp. WMMC1477]
MANTATSHHVPAAQRAYRALLYSLLEVRAVGFNNNTRLLKAAELIARRHIRKQIRDPGLRRRVTPDYTMGCKRALISNDYYPALDRPDVHVVTDGVREVREDGIVDEAGVERPVDAIIYGTGFHVTDAFDHLDITGTGGCTSWYLDAQGVNRTIWPGFTWRYWLRTRRFRTDEFTLTRQD